MERVRVGVVGTSWWADEMHLPNLRSHPQAEVVALCGRNRERAAELALKYAIPNVFTDYREMIARGRLNALVVATPDDTHYEIALAGLEAGLHVLCEKPLARTAKEAETLAETAARKGLKTMVFFTLRGSPAHRTLKELLAQNYLGRCYHITVEHFIGYGRSGHFGWRFDPQRATGALGDLGSHAIDLAQWFLGPITGVHAQLGHFVLRRDTQGIVHSSAPDSALLSVQFESGAQGILNVSTVGHVGERQIQHRIALHGENGTLEAGISLAQIEIRGVRAGETEFQTLPIPDKFWGAADRSNPFSLGTHLSVGDRLFIDGILNDEKIEPDFAVGASVQAIMDAALESNRTGCWIEIAKAI